MVGGCPWLRAWIVGAGVSLDSALKPVDSESAGAARISRNTHAWSVVLTTYLERRLSLLSWLTIQRMTDQK